MFLSCFLFCLFGDAAFSEYFLYHFRFLFVLRVRRSTFFPSEWCFSTLRPQAGFLTSAYARIQSINQSINQIDQLLYVVVVVVFFTLLTDRASTIPSNIRGCQSGTWSAGQKNIRGTSTKNTNTNTNKQKRQRERNKNNKIQETPARKI